MNTKLDMTALDATIWTILCESCRCRVMLAYYEKAELEIGLNQPTEYWASCTCWD